MRSGRYLDFLDAVEGRRFDLRAERRLRVSDRNLADKVLSFAAEERMFLNLNEHVAIARNSAVRAAVPFLRHSEPDSAVDARGNVNFARYLFNDKPGPAAVGARTRDDLTAAAAFRARRLNREDARRLLNTPAAAAVFARFRLRARLRAGSAARGANLASAEFNLFNDALGRFVQVERHAAADVAARPGPGAAPAPEYVAERAPEEIAERAENIAHVAERARIAVPLKARLAVTVVDFSLFLIFKDVKRLGGEFKFFNGFFVSGIEVRVVFSRRLAVRRRNFFLGRRAVYSKYFVIIAVVSHRYCSKRCRPKLERLFRLRAKAQPVVFFRFKRFRAFPLRRTAARVRAQSRASDFRRRATVR